uniref:Tr-type G domain-containing protein n=1 Tax=Heterorhabditis bacteriophora TaxID=37862 RepID=A0A1I7XJL0_HETBA
MHYPRKSTTTSDMCALLRCDGSNSTSENHLPPEMELGNIEYKVHFIAKLVNPSTSRLQHLITQMKWRLREGQGEAIYEIGVEDGGHMIGLTDDELEASLGTLRTMANALEASIVIVSILNLIWTLLAVLGGVDVGKSTLCGVMTQGCLDDGNGKTRLNLFRFPHEVRSGKTSSVCLDVIGFDSKGKVLVNYAKHSLEELVERSTKLVTLIDLAGDSKLVSAKSGPTATTREHLGLAAALNIPVFVIITKRDLVDKAHLDRVVHSVASLVSRAGMKAGTKRIKTKRSAVKAASELCSVGTIPILCISSVTGEGLRLFRCFLNVLPPTGTIVSRLQLAKQLPLFTVEEIFNVHHVGLVSSSIKYTSIIKICGCTGSHKFRLVQLYVVCCRKGAYKKEMLYWLDHSRTEHMRRKSATLPIFAQIGSIRRSRQPVQTVLPGEAASIAISICSRIQLRRGMVLLSPLSRPSSCHRFSASLFLLYHSTRHLCIGFQATVYLGSVSQTATVVAMDCPSLQQGKWATVTLEFFGGPEYVRAGTPLIFRQGKTKGMGEVIYVD